MRALIVLCLATLACGVSQTPQKPDISIQTYQPTQHVSPFVATGTPRTYSVQVDLLNVRAGPGTSYEVLGQLRRDDLVVANCDLNATWCAVDLRYPGHAGLAWVFAACIGAMDGECR